MTDTPPEVPSKPARIILFKPAIGAQVQARFTQGRGKPRRYQATIKEIDVDTGTVHLTVHYDDYGIVAPDIKPYVRPLSWDSRKDDVTWCWPDADEPTDPALMKEDL